MRETKRGTIEDPNLYPTEQDWTISVGNMEPIGAGRLLASVGVLYAKAVPGVGIYEGIMEPFVDITLFSITRARCMEIVNAIGRALPLEKAFAINGQEIANPHYAAAVAV